jgi:rhodanese-related sulfurtransferase
MFRPISILLAALVFFASPASFAAEHTGDGEALVRARLADGSALLVDVREGNEWDAGHLLGAVNVPLSELRAGRGHETLPTDRTLYLHCQSGRRVLPAADILVSLGFQDVRALPWGFPELVRRGLPQAP